METISPHVSYQEATKSVTAIRMGIENVPSAAEIVCMRSIAWNVFEPLRLHFNVPIGITSFFRCQALNRAVGGSSTSQHCKGQAVDLDADVYGGISNRQIFEFIRENLEFDQLIWEYGDDENPDWVHVSYLEANNRHQVLRAYRKGRRVVYQNFSQ